jgi:hypothetical protein
MTEPATDYGTHYSGHRAIVIKADDLTEKEFIELYYSVRIGSFNINFSYSDYVITKDDSTSTWSASENISAKLYPSTAYDGRTPESDVYIAPAKRCIYYNRNTLGQIGGTNTFKKESPADLPVSYSYNAFELGLGNTIEKFLYPMRNGDIMPEWVQIWSTGLDDQITDDSELLGYGIKFELPRLFYRKEHNHTWSDGYQDRWYKSFYMNLGDIPTGYSFEPDRNYGNNFFNLDGQSYEFQMHFDDPQRPMLNYTDNRYGEINYTANATLDIDRFSFKTESNAL